MDFFGILTMIGGLALFLYGMQVMGEGLSKVSGGKLEQLLEKLTSSKLKAVLLGMGVTVVIQSSSATTVMVVGFVNSGIMKLSQAIGIIMGANIGTTVTSWILSLSGIESSSFFIQLLKPTSFSPVLAIVGVTFLMFSKRDMLKDVAAILIGFAVLMFGMDTMSAAVKPLADVPEFTGILTAFSNPLLGLVAGLILTAVIQSSSASVGILQALCMTGSVTYGAVIPIIMGQNIGTCVTAMLSGIGASKNARRAALVHLYFNIIGTIIFMILFYTIHVFVPFLFMDDSATAAGVAVVHTIFNMFATIILLPFSKGLEKLAYLTIRDDENEQAGQPLQKEAIQILDSRFLNTPGFALEQCRTAAIDMASYAKEALFLSMGLIKEYDKKAAKRVMELENRVDRYEDELGSYLVKLSSKKLSEKDSYTVSFLLHNIGDFERISDHAVNIKEAAEEMKDKSLSFSNKASEELEVFAEAVKDIVNTSFLVFQEEDMNLVKMIEPLEEVIDYLNAELKKRHIKRLRKGKCTIEMGFILSDIITSYERVSDHCSNIGLSLLEISEDGFEAHRYIDEIREKNDPEFKDNIKRFQKRYELP
ncbi:Na/Pi cotransporter family protein [Kineothrix sp. MB12-C1]|uniref:Na/Pi cotransporter family protein n=1 Tax=Kineothrix sp. MB12-C1 TaxID=3070215 RepID=UPI0027D29F6C|nr:Na/Pi cotransporter family protein [Kineothrix sp. MB12-C1]WMC92088.1 Na/Pi cotransporter family protein [Kineothrix sp. MB12-C1]